MKPRYKLQPDGSMLLLSKTTKQVRAEMNAIGITIAQWSRENNMPHYLVREILAGRKKCLRGVSHNIAVLLGMKHGVLTDRPGRVTPLRLPKAKSGDGGAAA